MKRSSYTLNSSALDRALSILKKEKQAYQLTTNQHLAFTLLNIAVYAVGVTLGVILIAQLLVSFKFDPAFFGMIAETLLYLLYAAGSVIIIIIAVLSFLNFSLIQRFVRLNKLMNTLGISYAFETLWWAERRRKRLLNLLTMSLGPFLIVTSIILTPIYGLSLLGMGVSTGVAFIAMHLLRRSKERLDVIARLQTSFSGYRKTAEQDKETHVDIPRAEYNLLAHIERAQIAKERANSILASQTASTDETYLVQQSRAFREDKTALSASVKGRIQDQIDALTTKPRPEGVSQDPNPDVLRLRVPDTPLHIRYSVHDTPPRITILSLDVDDDTSTDSSAGG